MHQLKCKFANRTPLRDGCRIYFRYNIYKKKKKQFKLMIYRSYIKERLAANALTFSCVKLSISIWVFFTETFWFCLYCSTFPLLRNLYVSEIDSPILTNWMPDKKKFCVSCTFFWNPSNRVSYKDVELFRSLSCVLYSIMYFDLNSVLWTRVVL